MWIINCSHFFCGDCLEKGKVDLDDETIVEASHHSYFVLNIVLIVLDQEMPSKIMPQSI